ncbi:DNA-directed RNA polymerase I subunit RPA1 [Pseudohyphozyma bogoriensis]|nr:DNA-directed RNA polymerase I subunit RPA1 [Pseudohyphozyma bogoriensis]
MRKVVQESAGRAHKPDQASEGPISAEVWEGMNISTPVSSQVSSISFSSLHSSDIRQISVKQVVNPVLFDNLNQPNAGGLYDPAFGPRGKGDICTTCRLNSFDCPGHFGHIELPMPVFHPLYMTQAFQLLRGTCTFCHHFLASEVAILKYTAKLTLLEHGLVTQADAVDSFNLASSSKASAAAKKSPKKKHAGPATLSDDDMGESTEEPTETFDDFKGRLDAWVKISLGRMDKKDRDEYKRSGIVYDKRRRVMQEFLKSLVKKKCDRCGAYAHRLKKEGHTKILEYSLVAKQKAFHIAAGIKRRDVMRDFDYDDASKLKNGKAQSADVVMGGESADEDSGPESDDDGAKDTDGEDDMSVDDGDPDASRSEEEEEGQDRDHIKKEKQKERIITPKEVRAHLRHLFKNEARLVALLYSPHGPLSSSTTPPPSPASFAASATPDFFFMDVVSVLPTRFRPAATMGDQVFENPQNTLLNGILRQTVIVRDFSEALSAADLQVGADGKPAVDKSRLYTRLLESLIGLQTAVNSMMDNTKNPAVMKGGKEPPPGVKQLLEKKEGLFRKNMMGKRVNYAARSVISPDVNIETNEIGIPPVFARKLTFPEPVTAHNYSTLRQAVINGPNVHPGAAFIQMEDGNLISLDKLSEAERTAHANKLLAPESRSSTARLDRPDVGLPQTHTPQINRKVYRHLQDGDIVILNRQPTLHKPSMMCHRVKVLKGEKTIRMHYANCNSYNADFDGDEMNIHFPQSLVAQAEARLLANTDSQYLTPTSGNPLRGLIQDHVVSAVWLTNKDTFFTRQEYYQLIYGALRPEDDYTGEGMVKTLPPTIWKPKPLWTGKQIISTLLLNIKPPKAEGINFSCKAKVPGSSWGVHTVEDTVLFVDGELLTGVIDKAQIGASPFGLVHSVHELYGPEIAGKLLSILSRLLTKHLQSRAFTCRMDDLILTEKGNHDRRALLATVNQKGLKAALEYTGLADADQAKFATADDLRARLEEVLRDDQKMGGLDASVEGETNQVTTKVIKTCLPHGLVKPFPHNNMQTMTISGAKGSNVNASQISCLLGQQSLEGRRVPTMVSGKTLPSFKAFETAPRAGGFVAGRFLTGIRPQEYYFHCMAGREGLIDTAVKTSRSGYLQRCLIKHLEGLRVHYDHTVRNSDQSVLQFHYGEDSLDVVKQKHLLQFEFAVRNTETLVTRFNPKELIEHVVELPEKELRKILKYPESHSPVLSTHSPSTHLGSVSEMYANAVEKYIESNPHRLIRPKKEKGEPWPPYVNKEQLIKSKYFRSLMYTRYMRSLVEPGEAVGLMASQGVGEPSTQMTLNTFHFAGHGAANVTLGIPRLREIVMTASQHIKTPTMHLPILTSVSNEELKKFCLNSTRLTLSQVVDNVTVKERLSAKSEANDYSRQKLYTIRLELFPQADYAAEYSITPEQILLGIQRTFVPGLDRAILKEIKQNDKELNAQMGDVGKARSKVSAAAAARQDAAAAEGAEDEAEVGRDAGEEEDGDADDARRARQARDESDDESDSEQERDEADIEAAFDSSSEGEDSDDEDDEDVKKRNREDSENRMKAIESKIAKVSRYVNKVRFDVKGGEWCEFDLEFSSRAHKLLLVGIVESVCRTAIVHEIPGIARCFVAKAANENDAVNRNAMTEGVNLQACWNFGYGVVDLNQIYTNDIGALLRTYGVEAARRAIIKEMSGVFGVYGIGVDYRHLTIIADYMTSEGGYKPFNRTGLSNNSSPFLKASFETTANFVAEAALYGDFDDLGSPSANIVLGKVPRSGTGAFDLCAVEFP